MDGPKAVVRRQATADQAGQAVFQLSPPVAQNVAFVDVFNLVTAVFVFDAKAIELRQDLFDNWNELRKRLWHYF